MIIRNMDIDDVEKLRELDAIAFSRPSPRTAENVLSSIAVNPDGCFVVEEKDSQKIVGYIFSRIWGEVAWIGTFGVHPDYRGQGIGKELFETALSFLKEQGCNLIGLETVPDSAYNIGLYLKRGFQFTLPTLILRKVFANDNKLDNPPDPEMTKYNLLTEISGLVMEGLDYRIEAEIIDDNNWGKTLMYGDENPSGFSCISLVSAFEEETTAASIQALVMREYTESGFKDFLQQIESFIIKQGLTTISIAVNATNAAVVELLLSEGYEVEKTLARMVYSGNYHLLQGIDLSKWVM